MTVTTRIATLNDYDVICRLLQQGDNYHADLLPEFFRIFDGPTRPRVFNR